MVAAGAAVMTTSGACATGRCNPREFHLPAKLSRSAAPAGCTAGGLRRRRSYLNRDAAGHPRRVLMPMIVLILKVLEADQIVRQYLTVPHLQPFVVGRFPN